MKRALLLAILFAVPLALAYFRSGDVEKAVSTQRRAIDSPGFPVGYREEASRQLQEYEKALSAPQH
jgi:hypothetical protein